MEAVNRPDGDRTVHSTPELASAQGNEEVSESADVTAHWANVALSRFVRVLPISHAVPPIKWVG